MRSLAEQLLEYFDNTPQDILDRDWEEICSQGGFGIEAQDFINTYKSYRNINNGVSPTPCQTSQNITEEFRNNIDYAEAA